MAKLRKLTATGATVLALHHVGKGSTTSDYRGSSDIPGAVDVAFKLTRKDGAVGLEELQLSNFKMRCAEPQETIALRFGDDGFTVTEDTSGRRNADNASAALDWITKNPGQSQNSVVEGLRAQGLQRNQARRAIKAVIDSGAVRVNAGSRGTTECWPADRLELGI